MAEDTAAATQNEALLHNWAFEAGGGFNAPIATPITYGGQFTVGAGLNFSKYLCRPDRVPVYRRQAAGRADRRDRREQAATPTSGRFTFDPVIDLMPKATNGIYITGGGGFYRKVTSFTDPEERESTATTSARSARCHPQVVGHFSSNQGGFNIGGGFQHRVGGQYGDSNTKLFVEARYLDVLSPALITQPERPGNDRCGCRYQGDSGHVGRALLSKHR